MTFPVAVKPSPPVTEVIVCIPLQPWRPWIVPIPIADTTILISDAGKSHFQPRSINWS